MSALIRHLKEVIKNTQDNIRDYKALDKKWSRELMDVRAKLSIEETILTAVEAKLAEYNRDLDDMERFRVEPSEPGENCDAD